MESRGFELARAAVTPVLCSALRSRAIAEASGIEHWPVVRAASRALFGDVIREPARRIHLPLALCADVDAAILPMRPWSVPLTRARRASDSHQS